MCALLRDQWHQKAYYNIKILVGTHLMDAMISHVNNNMLAVF